MLKLTYRIARRIVVGLVGLGVLLVGVVMLVTPGPAFLVIPAGLAILGLEFAFARRFLRYLKSRFDSLSGQQQSSERVPDVLRRDDEDR